MEGKSRISNRWKGIFLWGAQTVIMIVCCTTISWNTYSLVTLFFLYLIITYFDFLIFRQKEDEVKESESHFYSFGFFKQIELDEETELTEQSKTLIDKCKQIEKLAALKPEQNENIVSLEIPIPEMSSKNNELPYKDYVFKLKSLPEDTPIMIGLEQFILSIHPKEELIDFTHSLMTSLEGSASEFLKNSYNDLCDFVQNTGHNIAIDVTFQNPDFLHTFFSNLSNELAGHFKSELSGYILRHNLEDGKIAEVIFKDFGKAVGQTVVDFDGIHNFEGYVHYFYNNAHDAIFENVSDIDVFQPDFDFSPSGHVPCISVVIEGFRQIDKLIDDKTDVQTAIKYFGIKIGGKTAGATVGSMIVPVIGSLIGAMIGGYIGSKIANEYIRKDFDDALQEYNNAIEQYNQKKTVVQRNLASSQVCVDRKIRNAALKEQNSFNNIKRHCPLSDESPINTVYAVNISLKDYLVNLYLNCANVFNEKGLLKYYNISSESLRCKRLLKHLHKTISMTYDVKNDYISSLEKFLLIQSTLEKNQPLLQKYIIQQEHLLYSDIIADCNNYLDSAIKNYNLILFIWYQTVYMSYKNAINNIVKETNTQFEWLQHEFKRNHQILENESDNVEYKKRNVEKEKNKI